MRFGSVFSGIEAASVAWHPLGWETAFVAEIDRIANHVLRHRLPDVPRRGNFQRPAAADLNEVLDMDVLKARCELEAFRFEAEGGNRPAPWEVEEPLTPR